MRTTKIYFNLIFFIENTVTKFKISITTVCQIEVQTLNALKEVEVKTRGETVVSYKTTNNKI